MAGSEMNAVFRKTKIATQSKFCMWGENFRKVLENCVESKSTGKLSIHLYQILAVLEVRQKLLQNPQPCLIVAPTSSGKSGMIFMLPYVLASNKVLILTPSSILTNQLAETFGSRVDNRNCFFNNMNISENHEDLSAFLEDVTIISNSRDAIEKQMTNVVIVTAQKFGDLNQSGQMLTMEYQKEKTIPNVRAFFEQFDTLIINEAHHYPWKTWKQIVDEFSRSNRGIAKKIIFLTATPHRILSNGDMLHVFGDPNKTAYTIGPHMCIGMSIRRLEFDLGYSNEMDFARHIQETLDRQHKLEPRFLPQAIVLAKNRTEVKRIVTQLNSFGSKKFAVGAAGDFKPLIEKDLKDFTAGKYRVAVTCTVGLDGYDNAKVTLCVIMKKITGKILFSQFVGRCIKIKRGLEKVNGQDLPDRSVGKVISYVGYEMEGMRREYEGMDQFIAGEDPRDEVDEELE